MPSQVELEIAICNMIMKICSKERFIEIKRQILSEKKDFEPYVAYQRIKRKDHPKGISKECLTNFFSENLVHMPSEKTSKLIQHYSTSDQATLNFKVIILINNFKIFLGLLEHDITKRAS